MPKQSFQRTAAGACCSASEEYVEAQLNVSVFSVTTSIRVGPRRALHSAQDVVQCRVKNSNSSLQGICNGLKVHNNYISTGLEWIF